MLVRFLSASFLAALFASLGYGQTTAQLADARAKWNAKDWAHAEPAWQQIVEQNPTNGEFWYRLAWAAYSNSDFKPSISAYEHVIESGYRFPSESEYNIACCWARLGDKGKATDWLVKAVKDGYRDVDSIAKDDDLKTVMDVPAIRQLLALDGSKLGRDEGWRSDIRFLDQEIKAKGWAPFRKFSESEFDANVAQFLNDIPKLSDTAIELRMFKLVADVGDGHTSVWGVPKPEFGYTLPVKFYDFAEGLYIIAAEPKYKDLLGAKVLTIDGKSPDELSKAITTYISRDNEQWSREQIPFRLRNTVFLHELGLTKDPLKAHLELSKLDGSKATIDLPADLAAPNIWNTLPNPVDWVNLTESAPGETPLYLKNMAKPYWFEFVPESKTLYFQYNKVLSDPSDPLPKFAARLNSAVETNKPDRLVIDLRWNNGGDTIINDQLLKALIRNPKLDEPGFTYVIVGRRTFSAAMNMASYLKRFLNPIFVGEPTGGKPNAAGDEVAFTLPYSGIMVNVSDVYWQGYWPEDHSNSIAPNILALPTFADYLSKRDPAMEAILHDHP